MELVPSPNLNVFIGENGVGKSNIFGAIQWLVGPYYPTFNATTRQDHYRSEEVNQIHICLEWDDGSTLDLNEEKDKYQFSMMRNGGFLRDLGKNRELFCCAYVDVQREIADYLPSNRWSLLGRLLLDINTRFVAEQCEDGRTKAEALTEALDSIRDSLLFTVSDDTGQPLMAKFLQVLQDESAAQLNKAPGDFSVNLNLYDPWNFYRTLQILVRETDIGMTFQASQLGMGAQAAITIAILRAYSEIKLGGGNPIFIDEPELFLHPLAQRNFHQILRKLSEANNVQIFYITHSPYMIALEHFDEIIVVRRSTERGTYVRRAEAGKFVEDLELRTGIKSDENTLRLFYKNAFEQTADSISSLEAFFANRVILVEGTSEALILPYLLSKVGFDCPRERTTVVKCGAKNEIDRFLRLYSELGIPCFVVFDGDRNKGEPAAKANQDILRLLGCSKPPKFPDGSVHERYIGFEYDLNQALSVSGFRNVYNSENPENSPKGVGLFVKVKEQVEAKKVNPPEWVQQLVTNVRGLPENVDSVLEESPF